MGRPEHTQFGLPDKKSLLFPGIGRKGSENVTLRVVPPHKTMKSRN